MTEEKKEEEISLPENSTEKSEKVSENVSETAPSDNSVSQRAEEFLASIGIDTTSFTSSESEAQGKTEDLNTTEEADAE